MANWVEPAYSRGEVNRAGATYIDQTASPEDRELALSVINNWRSSHSFPLNTLQINLRDVARQHEREPTVAQRIKRLPSIRHKLERYPTMDLARMHDIGGARVVLSSAKKAQTLVDYYRTKSRIKHKPVREDQYIENPEAERIPGCALGLRVLQRP